MESDIKVILLLTLGIILYAIAISMIAYILIERKKLLLLLNKKDNDFETLDMYLNRRWESIPDMVDIIEQRGNIEVDILGNIDGLRQKAFGQMSNEEKLRLDIEIAKELNKLIETAESQEDIVNTNTYRDIIYQLNSLDRQMETAIDNYNESAHVFNKELTTFPSNKVAEALKFRKASYYYEEDTNIEDRDNETKKIEEEKKKREREEKLQKEKKKKEMIAKAKEKKKMDKKKNQMK